MKKNIFKSLLAGACIVALAGCDDNSWNNEHLDGFDDNPAITDVQSIEYTLTAADYASIAANDANKALAGETNADALKAVGTQHYFTDVITAKDYIPAFLGSNKFEYFVLDNGSAVKATYKVAQNLPEEVTAVAGAEQYTISKENYQAVWESNKNFVESFTPAKPADKAIPEILKAQYPDATAGQYAIVSYNNATTEPSFASATTSAKTFAMSRSTDADLTSTIGNAVIGETCEAKGIVTAICAQGYILTDNSGSILVYHGKTYDKSHVVGDIIKISATVGSYNKGLQLTGSGATETKEGTKTYSYPTPMKMTGADMDALLTSRVNDELAVYAQFVGTPSISGNYINIAVDGAVTAIGSIYQATEEQKAMFTDGEEVLISGYFSSISSGKYINFVLTKVEDPNAAASDADLTSALGSVVLNQTYDVKGIVTAICAQGYVLTDNTGSILVYYGKTYAKNHKVGDVVKINAPVGSYGTALQLTGSKATEEIVGSKEVVYPEPVVMSGADMDVAATRTENELAIYAQFQGTASVSNYINITVEGATTSQGSIYQATDEQKAMFTDGEEAIITGYFVSVSSGKYVNFIPTKVEAVVYDGVVIPSVKENAVYCFDGAKWSVPAEMTILNPADYEAMGQKYGNLSKDAKPEDYLPLFLKNKFPYAQAEETEFVVYKYYEDKTNFIRCDQYVYDGTVWAANTGIVEETAQFVKNEGKWMFDPNVTITLPAGGGQELSVLYYQACTDWVFENIDKPLGSTDKKSGKFYVSSYGNNEYYSGTSAYYGNVDLRASAAKGQYPTEYGAMEDDAVVELMKKRFCEEVMPGALAMLHPDAAPVPGLQVIYTINFTAYNGTNSEHTVRYEVVEKGKFQYIDCTWYEKEAE